MDSAFASITKKWVSTQIERKLNINYKRVERKRKSILLLGTKIFIGIGIVLFC